MEASNGPLHVQPWTCPHCSAVWHSGRQYCVDCGYGMGLQEQAETVAALGTMPRKTAEEIEYNALKREKAQGLRWRESGAVPGEAEGEAGVQAVPDAQTHATLRRSLQAESALQAEVQLLRERTAQLEARLDEQRRVFAGGVQQMLEPLREVVEGAGHGAVPVGELCTHAAGWIRELGSHVRRLEAEAKTLRRPVEVRRVAPEMQLVQELCGLVARLESRLARLEEGAGGAEKGPQTYDTFVMSDRQSADIERALLDAQARGPRFAQG